MYRLGLDAILGFHKKGESLTIDPVIPPSWDGFKIHYRYEETVYHIEVLNPGHVSQQSDQILSQESKEKILHLPVWQNCRIRLNKMAYVEKI